MKVVMNLRHVDTGIFIQPNHIAFEKFNQIFILFYLYKDTALYITVHTVFNELLCNIVSTLITSC